MNKKFFEAELLAGLNWPNESGADSIENLGKESKWWLPQAPETTNNQMHDEWSHGANGPANSWEQGEAQNGGPKPLTTTKDAKAKLDKSKDITDEYMNKPPKTTMGESLIQRRYREATLELPQNPLENTQPVPLPPVSPVGPNAYDSEKDKEETAGLDTFAHAATPAPVHEEGDLLEAAANARAALHFLESGKGAEAIAFLQQNPEGSYNEFIRTGPHELISPTYFRNIKIKMMGMNGSPDLRQPMPQQGGGGAFSAYDRPEEVLPTNEIDAADLDPEFSGIVGSLSQSGVTADHFATATVAEKYEQLYHDVREWSAARMSAFEQGGQGGTSGFKRHILVTGSPGIGKTYTCKEAIVDAINEGIDFKTHYVRGSVGQSPSEVAGFFYRFRKDYLIVFDDCDDFLDNAKLANFMKGILELDNPQINTGGLEHRVLGLEKARALSKDQPIRGYIQDTMLPNSGEDAANVMDIADSDMDQADGESHLEDAKWEPGEDIELLDRGEGLPQSFAFRSRILFISNKSRKAVNSAVLSRVLHRDLTLTSQEIVDRMGALLPDFLKNDIKYSVEIREWAKLHAYRWLKFSVTLQGRPLKLNDATTIALPYPRGMILEFRHLIDLVQGWISQASRYEGKTRQALMPPAVVQNLPIDFIRGFVVSELGPTLEKAAQGGKKG